jgi:hypothetical protein
MLRIPSPRNAGSRFSADAGISITSQLTIAKDDEREQGSIVLVCDASRSGGEADRAPAYAWISSIAIAISRAPAAPFAGQQARCWLAA